jgi:hypothetical protein
MPARIRVNPAKCSTFFFSPLQYGLREMERRGGRGPSHTRQTAEEVMLRKIVFAGFLAMDACGICHGQVTLEQKFVDDSSYTTESTARLQQTLSIAGMDVETSSDTKSTSKSTLGKRDAEGKLHLEQKVQSLQVTIDVMGMNYTFDSANPDDKGTSPLEVIRDVHKALAKQTTTIVYDKSNRAVAVETNQDIVGSLPTAIQDLVKSQLDPAQLKNKANEEIDQVKADPVNKGDTWQRTVAANFGAGQMMDFKTEYTYEGTVDKDGKTLDRITSKILEVNFALDNSPLPLALKSSDLKAAESAGVILFDRQRGQIVDSNASMRITGEMTFTVNNMDLPAKLDLKIESATVVKP